MAAGSPEATVERWEGLAHTIVADYYAPGFDFDDLLQEARIGAWLGIRNYDSQRNRALDGAWIGMCIRRAVITAVKTATREKHHGQNFAVKMLRDPESGRLEPAVDRFTDGDTVVDVVIRREELSELGSRIRERLTELERGCLTGLVNGEDYGEIAARLGVGCKAVDNALIRTRKKLS